MVCKVVNSQGANKSHKYFDLLLCAVRESEQQREITHRSQLITNVTRRSIALVLCLENEAAYVINIERTVLSSTSWTVFAPLHLSGVGPSAKTTAKEIRKYISGAMSRFMNIKIQKFLKENWSDVSEIYRQGLLTRNATFEMEVPEYEAWIKKFHGDLLWVAILEGNVVGWAGLQPVSVRKVYEGVVEVTIYIHNQFAGKRIGSALMKHLIEESEKAGIWTLYASIFPENTASIRLHVTNGFREIGFREKIAQLDNRWRNTVLFERRSKKIGV